MPLVTPWRDHRPQPSDRPAADRSERQRAEDVERATLSSWAVAASESKGRERPEPSDPYRTAFHVDRDRVLATTAFSALAGKAAGLPADRHPSRMEQTIRVAALAGWMARSLRLNVDLTDAIAFASTLGAPPFAEGGRDALTSLIGEPFVIGEQSLRVVERLGEGEPGRSDGGATGLNLTWEVRDGLAHAGWDQTPASTCEGQVVRLAARVVAAVDAWVAAGRPEVSPSVHRELGASPDAIASALLGDVLAAPGTSPEILTSDAVERYLPEIDRATDRAEAGDQSVRAERERAVHVVSSLVVYEVERAADEDLARAVDLVCTWSDTDGLAAFRARFQPAG